MACATDAQFVSVIRALRAALPRPYLLTTAAWSIGAYGQGAWLGAQPQGDHTGMSVNPLRQAGGLLDQLNVMSYDASAAYDPKARAHGGGGSWGGVGGCVRGGAGQTGAGCQHTPLCTLIGPPCPMTRA